MSARPEFVPSSFFSRGWKDVKRVFPSLGERGGVFCFCGCIRAGYGFNSRVHIQIQVGKRKLSVTADAQMTLAAALDKAGIQLNMRCGGEGVCGGCQVQLGQGHYRVNGHELSVPPGGRHDALACQTHVLNGSGEITVPPASLLETDGQIVADFQTLERSVQPVLRQVVVAVPAATPEVAHTDWERLRDVLQALHPEPIEIGIGALRELPAALADGGPLAVTLAHTRAGGWEVLRVAPAAQAALPLAAAVDIGTTTVVLVLVDPASGHILARASKYNQQIRKADDVASRISFCRTAKELHTLQDLVIRQTINPLLEEACKSAGVATDRVLHLVVAGNTVMMHLFLGLSPYSIGRLPFQGVRYVHPVYRACDLGLAMHHSGRVDVVPSVAGYIGGDIVADMYAAHLQRRDEPALLVDIGTNSEIVYAENRQLWACATAAGPAFEGAGLLHGRRAAPGAIEHICISPELDFTYNVIGGGKPEGICGSAIIDFLAEGFRCGLINAQGRYDVERLKRHGRHQHIRLRRGSSHACLLVLATESATGHALVVTESDIAQVLKVKASTYAGLKTLLNLRGRKVSAVPRIVLAGGFARHINVANAITLGLLPDLPLERFETLGNGSLAGAYLAVMDVDALAVMEKIARQPRVVELNLKADFEDNFIDAMMIPNLNTEEFPSVKI